MKSIIKNWKKILNVLNISFADRDYYGRKSGRSLSFVASSLLDKDAKFLNKRISRIEIVEKNSI
jgi:hypothetical protein